MNELNTLTIFTKALLDKGMDYEVTLKGSEVSVKLFDRLTGNVIGQSTKDSLEASLASVLANIASRPYPPMLGLSIL